MKPVEEDAEYTPRSEYGSPTLDCDLVMKGGITSGVIYPLAICKLAEKYRLHSIGGASAGAIAAAAAAAAEYARQERRLDGFTKLQELPDRISATTDSGRTRLMSLFQPDRATRTAFSALLIGVRKSGTFIKIARLVGLVCTRHLFFPVLAVLVATALVAAAGGGAWQTVVTAFGALLVLVAGIAGAAIVALLRANRAIARNGAGICSGHAAVHRAGEPALCEWLADLIDEIAGHPPDQPLTFGDLRKHDIELAMMTTNLSHGRPYRVPFADDAGFFFKKREIEKLFPSRIAKALRDAGYASVATRSAALQQTFADNGGREGDYVPLPPGDLIPVVFGARLSLSFPVLLSAIPLYAVDWTSVRHPDLDAEGVPEAASSRGPQDFPPKGPYLLSRCWFSDGGICSNLPIHFFDSLLPRRPTFALDLRLEHPQHRVWTPESKGKGSELDNVWIPETPNAGFAEGWERVGSHGGISVVQLIKTMVNTMQCWNDNMLAKAPGYRDRIIHISHRADEGGLNLEMPRERITRLSLRGAAAGHKIGGRFDRSPTSTGWNNHLWVRYRTALGMLHGLLSKAHERYFTPEQPGTAELEALFASPPSYRFATPQEAAAARAANAAFGESAGFDPKDPDFVDGAPRPLPDLRPRPRGG